MKENILMIGKKRYTRQGERRK